MSFSIEYTRTAERELLEVFAWIRERAPLAAQKWRLGVIAKVDSIANDPFSFRKARESARLPVEVRQALYGKRRSQYRILYMVEGTRVFILSIRHSFRRPLDPDDFSSL
jgi:plasmid stabilization system protein ParE